MISRLNPTPTAARSQRASVPVRRPIQRQRSSSASQIPRENFRTRRWGRIQPRSGRKNSISAGAGSCSSRTGWRARINRFRSCPAPWNSSAQAQRDTASSAASRTQYQPGRGLRNARHTPAGSPGAVSRAK